MKLFNFLSKVAFLYNLFFVVCLILRYNNFIGRHTIEEFVIINGWLLALILNAIVSILFIFSFLKYKKGIKRLKWVVVVNSAFFLFQLYYFFM